MVLVQGPVVLMVTDCVCVMLLVPVTVMNIGAGFLFGVWGGLVTGLTGCLLGAAGAFTVARHFAYLLPVPRPDGRAGRYFRVREEAQSGARANERMSGRLR